MLSLFPVHFLAVGFSLYKQLSACNRQEGRKSVLFCLLFEIPSFPLTTFFYVTVGSEVKPGGYTTKTLIVVLFIDRKKNWHLSIFPKSQLICLVSRVCCQTKTPLSASFFSHRFLET